MKQLLPFALCIALFSSCKKEDETAPSLAHLMINGVHDEPHFANAGQLNTAELTFSDNKNLAQWSIELSTPGTFQNHSGHEGHETVDMIFQAPNIGGFDTSRVFNLFGTSGTGVFSFELPDTLYGIWDLNVAVLDEAGNLTTEEHGLFIYNANYPTFTINGINATPDESGVLNITTADNLIIDGTVFDVDGLALLDSYVTFNGDTTFQQTQSSPNSSVDLSTLTPPVFSGTGTHYWYIRALDTNGWSMFRRVRVKI